MPPIGPEKRAAFCRAWALVCALLVCAASVTGCPHKCSCSGSHVDCQGLGLKTVPKGIPRNAERLDLNRNNITRVTKVDFSGLKNLRFFASTETNSCSSQSFSSSPTPNSDDCEYTFLVFPSLHPNLPPFSLALSPCHSLPALFCLRLMCYMIHLKTRPQCNVRTFIRVEGSSPSPGDTVLLCAPLE
ncbi:hypothetical protein F7725_010484, partial [Dissostichus mawsoni]